jgi:hypothetical protein
MSYHAPSVRAVPGAIAVGLHPSWSWNAWRYWSGTFEVVFGQILLAIAEISFRRVAVPVAAWVYVPPDTAGRPVAHTS